MKRFTIPVIGLAILLALSVPFLFWYQTWFGRPLSDAEIARDLDPTARPRDTQHALTQLATTHAERWNPRIAALSRHENAGIRMMAAWAMGQDNQSDLFHRTLLTALKDPVELVRRNAALALIRFGDASGRTELRRILETETDERQLWEALRGLDLIGQQEDLPAVEKQLRGVSPAIRAQAALTSDSIRRALKPGFRPGQP